VVVLNVIRGKDRNFWKKGERRFSGRFSRLLVMNTLAFAIRSVYVCFIAILINVITSAFRALVQFFAIIGATVFFFNRDGGNCSGGCLAVFLRECKE
jgi:hypothetical protein